MVEQLRDALVWLGTLDWLAALTAVLVVVTGYYAKQNRDMAREMRASRKQAVLPHVRPSYEHYGGGVGFPRIVNVGPGVAIDTDVTLTYEPGGGFARRWTAPILVTQEFRELVIKDATGSVVSVGDAARDYERVRIVGSCKDALGDVHSIDASFELREWWDLAKGANERLVRGKRPELVIALEKIEAAILGKPWSGSI